MNLVRDLLDTQVVDRNGRLLGRVDGIVLENGTHNAPRLAAILIGPTALGFRLHPTLGRWIAAAERAWGLPRQRPVRIDAVHIVGIGRRIKTDVAASDTAAYSVEHRVRAWLARIPGGR